MNHIMFGLIAAIYSSFFHAISQLALKKGYRNIQPSVAFLLDAAFGLLVWIPLALLFGIQINQLPAIFPYALLSAILSEALYFYASSKGELSLTNTIIGTYSVYTLIFSYVINGERLTPLQFWFVASAIIGTAVTLFPRSCTRADRAEPLRYLWPILAALGIGLSDTLSKRAISASSWPTFLICLAFAQIPIALCFLALQKIRIRQTVQRIFNNPHRYTYSTIGSCFSIAGTGLLWISFSRTLASIASPITSTSRMFIVLFSVLFLKEKLSVRHIIGIIITFAGILGISSIGE